LTLDLWAVKVPEERPSPIGFYEAKHILVMFGLFGDNDGSLKSEKIRIVPDTATHDALVNFLRGACAASSDIAASTLAIAKLNAMLQDVENNPNGVDLWIGDWDDHGDPEPEE
jgi:hypothetical protein